MGVIIKESKIPDAGLGVFAEHGYGGDATIIACPFMIFQGRECGHIMNTYLHNYIFEWGEDGVALAVGDASYINHSERPNCWVEFDEDEMICRVRPVFSVFEGQELTIDYGYDPLEYEEEL